MTSPEIKVKFFEHEDNPLPEKGSVHVITTGDGFDLRLGLWPVPGFEISIGEPSGDPEAAEETSADAGNEKPGDPSAGSAVSSEDVGTKPDDGDKSASSLVSEDTVPDVAATANADDPDQADGNDLDSNRDDIKTNEAIPDETDGSTETGASVESDDTAPLNEDADAARTNTGLDPDASAENADVTGAADQSGQDDLASKPEARQDPDDKLTVAAATSKPVIVEDAREQAEEKDATSAAIQGDQNPVIDAKSEPVADAGEAAQTEVPTADDQAKPAETSEAPPGPPPGPPLGPPIGPLSGPPPADTVQSAPPLEQTITMSGTIIVLNGRSEFIEKYAEVIRELIDRGFCVAALDWRGQGGSERLIKGRPLKGHIDDMDSYVEDLTTLLDFLETTNCPKPYYCLAHSTGGQVLLRAAPLISSRISRAVTTAPFLDLASYRTPKPVVYAFASTLTYAGLGEMYAPGAGRNPPSDDPFEGNAYSSDPHRYKRTADLVLRHKELAVGGPTVSWMYAALKSAGELFDPDFLSSITLPVMMLSASEDKVVSIQAVENFASMARTVSHLSIPGARHEILMERDEIRSQFWAAFDAFIPGGD